VKKDERGEDIKKSGRTCKQRKYVQTMQGVISLVNNSMQEKGIAENWGPERGRKHSKGQRGRRSKLEKEREVSWNLQHANPLRGAAKVNNGSIRSLGGKGRKDLTVGLRKHLRGSEGRGTNGGRII